MEFTQVQEKRCPYCREVKPLSAFSWRNRRGGHHESRCKQCRKSDEKARRAPVLAELAAQKRDERKAAPEHARNIDREYYAANTATKRQAQKLWRKANRQICNAIRSAREARKLQAIPSWADPEAIKLLYAKAREWSQILGIELHVDHAIPLKSPLVCGLHTHANLQLLEKVDNIRKGNRHWPDMPNEIICT